MNDYGDKGNTLKVVLLAINSFKINNSKKKLAFLNITFLGFWDTIFL